MKNIQIKVKDKSLPVDRSNYSKRELKGTHTKANLKRAAIQSDKMKSAQMLNNLMNIKKGKRVT